MASMELKNRSMPSKILTTGCSNSGPKLCWPVTTANTDPSKAAMGITRWRSNRSSALLNSGMILRKFKRNSSAYSHRFIPRVSNARHRKSQPERNRLFALRPCTLRRMGCCWCCQDPVSIAQQNAKASNAINLLRRSAWQKCSEKHGFRQHQETAPFSPNKLSVARQTANLGIGEDLLETFQ
jgi:hypothetical protein